MGREIPTAGSPPLLQTLRVRNEISFVPLPRKAPPLEPLHTVDDLVERWGFCRDTIYRIPAELLPYMTLGPKRGARRYRLEDIEAYEARCRVEKGG